MKHFAKIHTALAVGAVTAAIMFATSVGLPAPAYAIWDFGQGAHHTINAPICIPAPFSHC